MKTIRHFNFHDSISRRNFRIFLALGAVTTFSAHGTAKDASRIAAQKSMAPQKTAAVFQFSTLPALSLGLYDGQMTFGELLKRGNFGLGTFDALDGEGVILNGKAWRIGADGHVSRVENNATTPFAIVTNFAPDQTLKSAQTTNYLALQQRISSALPTINAPYAIEIRGTFARMKVRSVPRQSKPYRPLTEVVKTQSVWEWKNVRGTLVGFRFPGYLSGVNLADYHFHFLADDKQRGGHLLDCDLQNGEIKIQILRDFKMQLPTTHDFDHANLATNQSAALQTAEKAGAK